MSEVLLVEIDFNDQTWYLSEEGFIGDNYYAPYLESSPELELGQIKGGYISVRIGNISIANRANDRSSPFSILLFLIKPSKDFPMCSIIWLGGDL